MSDRALAERFSDVVLPHLGDALALARWLTGNAADAEDVVQDACIKAHAGISGYAGGNARAWLLTIVRNTSYTWMARNRPRAMMAVGDLGDLDDMAAGPRHQPTGGGRSGSEPDRQGRHGGTGGGDRRPAAAVSRNARCCATLTASAIAR
ncbi:DNA-directed RNA polymerase specialized sigma24 family protein [Mesorhizobium sp. URHB0026]